MSREDEKQLLTLLELHAQHAIHSNKLRYWFSSIYVAILSAIIITDYVESLPSSEVKAILVSIIILSLIGLLINIHTNYLYFYHMAKERVILKKLSKDRYTISTYGTPLYPYGGPNLSLFSNFSFWYSVSFVFFLSISSYSLARFYVDFVLSLVIGLVIFSLLFLFAYVHAFRKLDRLLDHIERKHAVKFNRNHGGQGKWYQRFVK